MAWITEKNKIYYGLKNKESDIEISNAPDQFHEWNGNNWILNEDRKSLYLREEAKKQRQDLVDKILVTTSTGKVFDGDEISQTRMTRAIIALQSANIESTLWVLADNTPTQATLLELIEALCLAGTKQAELWVI